MRARLGAPVAVEQPQVAAHEAGEVARDSEAEPRPLAGLALQARELPEHEAAPLGRDAGPAVDDLDRQAHGVVAARGAHPHADLAAGGELDRVAHEVRRDLPEARLVAHEAGGRVERVVQRHPPRGAVRGRGQADDLRERPLQVERRRAQRELAHLQARGVEHVVDDVEERQPRIADRVHAGARLLVHLAFEQEVGHADHAVHRRAELVAHPGEEPRLRPHRRLGLGPRAHERGLALALGGDVHREAHDVAVLRAPVLQAHRAPVEELEEHGLGIFRLSKRHHVRDPSRGARRADVDHALLGRSLQERGP